MEFTIPTTTPISDELSESVLIRLILIDWKPTEPSKPRRNLSINWSVATRGGSAQELCAELLRCVKYGSARLKDGECRGYWVVTGEIS